MCILQYVVNYQYFFYSRLFHVFTFFFLFYYMLVGILKAIARIISSAVLNLFYLSRLDKALTVKGWEWLDKGMFVAKVYGAISH